MIRHLTRHDHTQALAYLRREPELNLFTLGDLENYGYDFEQVEYWAELNERGELLGILTRYFRNLIFYSREAYSLGAVVDLIESVDFGMLMGESSILEPLAQKIRHLSRHDDYLARLAAAPPEEGVRHLARVERADLSHVHDIARLLRRIKEFQEPEEHEIRHRLANQTSRAHFITEGREIVALAQSAAETPSSAMIIGVATDPAWRGWGLATACMTSLCRELIAEGKTPCLFYDNPAAGRIYKRLGFVDISRWTMLTR